MWHQFLNVQIGHRIMKQAIHTWARPMNGEVGILLNFSSLTSTKDSDQGLILITTANNGETHLGLQAKTVQVSFPGPGSSPINIALVCCPEFRTQYHMTA